jgi:hypothetical protein
MPDQPSPRRRFQFRLRTLMIGVTLLGVACGYVGSQVNIVRDRRALAGRCQRRRSGREVTLTVAVACCCG